MRALNILFISVCALIAGAAGVCAVLSGLQSIVMAPVFAVFGWYYIFPIFVLVAVMWLCVGRFARMPWSVLFVVFGAALGGGLMAFVGRSANDLQMHDGMVLGGLLAGAISNLMIIVLRDRAEPVTAPNGGPAPPLGNSGVTEGPPSVS
jgi:hypothetical protein